MQLFQYFNQQNQSQQNCLIMNKSTISFNKFFNDNAIKQIPRFTSVQLNSSRVRSQSSKQLQLHSRRRKTSAVSIRLNPKTFLHREVFNTKLYQTVQSKFGEPGNKNMKKFFNITLNKQQRAKSDLKFGDETGIYFSQISKTFSTNNFYNNAELSKIWQTITHNIGILQKYLRCLDSTQPIKHTIKHTMMSIQQFLINFSKQYTKLQQYKKQQQINLTNLKRKRDLVHEQQLIQLQTTNNTNKIKQQIAESNSINKYKIKLNILDFENKKLLLKVQKLEQEIKQAKESIKHLSEENKVMWEEKRNIQKWKEDHDYKINKLKEQLEVAHIVKDQNLQQKLNYILGWKI